MHGTLRLCLATIVVLSHLGRPGPIHIGVSAVVIFYMLSGYVVARLLEKYFPPGRLLDFYFERTLRIYPLYLFCLLLASAFLFTTQFGSPKLTLFKAFAHLTIVPLNYAMFLDVSVIRGFAILPTAWSLGVEIQAYAILPLIIRSSAAKWIAGLFSLLVFSAAVFGQIDPDTWGFRLLPGILFVFLTGTAVAKTLSAKSPDLFDRLFPTVCWIWSLLLLLCHSVAFPLSPHVFPVLLGFIIGLPIIMFTSHPPIRIPFDNALGRISYGLFLIHFPVSWCFDYYFTKSSMSRTGLLSVIAVSIALSAVATYTLEQKMWAWRKAVTNG